MVVKKVINQVGSSSLSNRLAIKSTFARESNNYSIQSSLDSKNQQQNQQEQAKIQKQISVMSKEMAEIKKFNKLFSGLYNSAVETAKSKSTSNKAVEPEPKHLYESLSQSIMAEMLPMIKIDLKEQQQDLTKLVTIQQFRFLESTVNNLSSQIPQTDLQLAQLLLRAEEFATKQHVQREFENNNTGVRAVTALMELQTQEIEKLEEKLAAKTEITKLKDIFKDYIQEVNLKLKPYITAEYFEKNLDLAVIQLESKINQIILQIQDQQKLLKRNKDKLDSESKIRQETQEANQKEFDRLGRFVDTKISRQEYELMLRSIEQIPSRAEFEDFFKVFTKHMEHYDIKNNDYTKQFQGIREIITRFDQILCEKANKFTLESFMKDVQFKIQDVTQSVALDLAKLSQEIRTKIDGFHDKADQIAQQVLNDIIKGQQVEIKNLNSSVKSFKIEMGEQINKVDKKILKKSEFEEFKNNTAQVEQIACYLQHTIVLLNESLQLQQFKADETKQGKSIKVQQLISQAGWLQKWVLKSQTPPTHLHTELNESFESGHSINNTNYIAGKNHFRSKIVVSNELLTQQQVNYTENTRNHSQEDFTSLKSMSKGFKGKTATKRIGTQKIGARRFYKDPLELSISQTRRQFETGRTTPTERKVVKKKSTEMFLQTARY